jgi:hypothetical protein
VGRPRIEHRLEGGVEVKRCGACTEWRPLDQFSRDAARWDGLTSTCRTCFSKITKNYRAKNRDKVLEYGRRYAVENRARKSVARVDWRRRNPERDEETRRRYVENNRERIRELDRARYQRDRDKRVAYNRQYYEADKGRRIAQVRQWRLDNPEAAAAKGVRDSARRRARLRGLPYERWTEEQVIARDGLVCWVCGVNVDGSTEGMRRGWAIDHLIPIAAEYDGHPGDTLPNLAVACHACNRSKANKLLPEAIARHCLNLAREG